MLYDGSAIAAGRAVALVVAVGRDTEAGAAPRPPPDPPPSGVEQRLGALTRLTVPVTVAGGAVVTGLGFLYRRPARDAVGAGVALTVAAVPEGLPTLATITQVAAARRLASRNALVRNPRALEALGRVDQVCFDKTGTLTARLDLARVRLRRRARRAARRARRPTAAARARGRAARDAAASTATTCSRTPPTKRSSSAPRPPASATGLGCGAWDRIDEIPFESRRGYHAVLGNDGTGTRWITREGRARGRPSPRRHAGDATTRTVALDAATRRALEDHVEQLGRRGLRVLAVAEAPTAQRRPSSATAREIAGLELARLRRRSPTSCGRPPQPPLRDLAAAGVRVAMITGDHPSTAEAIAAELGLLDDGRVLDRCRPRPARRRRARRRCCPTSPCSPASRPLHKVRIVEAYQRAGRTVAMTGDGANDAAAIRLADAGIALGGRGTAAARATADVVVVDDRIETIVDAIVEGRAMWDSVRDAIAILVGGNLGELGFILVGSALTGDVAAQPPPAPARQPAHRHGTRARHRAARTARPHHRDAAARRPDASLGGPLARQIAIRAGATATGASSAWVAARMTGTPTRARTVALAALVGTQLGQTLVVGGRSPLVLGATAVSAAALVTVIQTPGVSQFFGCRPLGPVGWFTATGASASDRSVDRGSVGGHGLGERINQQVAHVEEQFDEHEAFDNVGRGRQVVGPGRILRVAITLSRHTTRIGSEGRAA